MSYLLEPVRPKRRTLCNVLRKSTNWKCLILTNLILSCLGAIIWCRNTRITKILVDFNAFPITSRRQVSPCADGYVYIPIAFVIMLYGLYLVECWHSSARIQLSMRKVDVGSVYRKIHDMRESQPVIWWKAICYHYVRRVRQTTRRRNGETLTSSQTYYERVNSNARGSSFFYSLCGMKDCSKNIVDLEKYPATKIKFSKGFVFANLTTVSEFEEQRSTFFRDQERMDDYMEMREGFEFPNLHFSESLIAWASPESPPWFGRIRTFWAFSLLLLSWPLRICLELNTAHLHYKITKVFGVNYPSDTNIFELERPLVTSNYLQHILQQQAASPRRVPPHRRAEFNYHNHSNRRPHQQQQPSRNRNRNRSRLSPARTPTPTRIQNASSPSPSSAVSAAPSYTEREREPLLSLPENAFANNAYAHACSRTSDIRKEKSASQSQCYNGSEYGSHFGKNEVSSSSGGSGSGNLFGFGGWSNFTSSFFRRTLSATRNTPFFPRSVTLMIEPSAERRRSNNYDDGAKRNYSFYSNSMGFNDQDDDEDAFLVPSYSEALLLLEPKRSGHEDSEDGDRDRGRDDDEHRNSSNRVPVPNPCIQQVQNCAQINGNGSQSRAPPTSWVNNGHLPNDNEPTYQQQSIHNHELDQNQVPAQTQTQDHHSSCPQHQTDFDRNRFCDCTNDCGHGLHGHNDGTRQDLVTQSVPSSSAPGGPHHYHYPHRHQPLEPDDSNVNVNVNVNRSRSSTNILPAAVELDLTHPIVLLSPSDARGGRALVHHRHDPASTGTTAATNANLQQHQESESAELIQELPPSYIEALQTSRPVFLSTLTRLRRCFTERDLAGGISSSSNSHRDYVRDRIQQSWLNYYYARTNPGGFLQRFHNGSGSGNASISIHARAADTDTAADPSRRSITDEEEEESQPQLQPPRRIQGGESTGIRGNPRDRNEV